MGKAAAILGPTLTGVVALLTHDSRLAILSITILFVIGAVFLMRVRVAPAGRLPLRTHALQPGMTHVPGGRTAIEHNEGAGSARPPASRAGVWRLHPRR